jgi:hypothetical protein
MVITLDEGIGRSWSNRPKDLRNQTTIAMVPTAEENVADAIHH